MAHWEYFIARRYLRSRSKSGFLSYTTVISIVDIVLGVGALIIVLSVLNGFTGMVTEKFLDFESHIRISTSPPHTLTADSDIFATLAQMPDIDSAVPMIQHKAMLIHNERQTGFYVKGLDVQNPDAFAAIRKHMILTEASFFDRSAEERFPGIVLGNLLADRLGLKVGDAVTVMSSRFPGGLYSVPPMQVFRVSGYFSVGVMEFDNSYALTDIASASKLFRMQSGITDIQIRVSELEAIDSVSREMVRHLPEHLQVRTWADLHKSLFAAMRLERIATILVLSLIIVLAAFNIICTLIMVVMDKTREVGILKSMGAHPSGILKIFVGKGLWVALTGIGLGTATGCGLVILQDQFHLLTLPTDVYVIEYLPVQLQIPDVLSVVLLTFLITLFGALYPAHRASQLQPVEAIRYE